MRDIANFVITFKSDKEITQEDKEAIRNAVVANLRGCMKEERYSNLTASAGFIDEKQMQGVKFTHNG